MTKKKLISNLITYNINYLGEKKKYIYTSYMYICIYI